MNIYDDLVILEEIVCICAYAFTDDILTMH